VSTRAAQAMLVLGALAIVFGVNVLRGAFFMGTYKTDDVVLGGAAGTIGCILIAVGAAALGKRWIGLGVAIAVLGGGTWYVLSLRVALGGSPVRTRGALGGSPVHALGGYGLSRNA
jgi:hypothetical protein